MPRDPLILAGRSGYVLVNPEIVSTARRFLQAPEGRVEAGGILLGCYRGEHLDVLHLTTPMAGDRRSVARFDRRDRGHDRAARSVWRQSGGTVTYVGEWHSHTAGPAEPSGQDLWTWRRILLKSYGRQHLFVIVSPRETRFIEGADGRFDPLRMIGEERDSAELSRAEGEESHAASA